MEQIPRELLCLIVAQLGHADRALLALTSKVLRKRLQHKNNVLDCCVYDGTLTQVQLCEKWGNSWTENTYYQLGLSGNVELAEYRCIKKMFGFCRFQVSHYAEEIYKGACHGGHSSLLEWLYRHYRTREYFDEQLSGRGPKLAARGHHYHLLDEFVQHRARSLSEVLDTAGLLLDLELIKYCNQNKITSLRFLDAVAKSKKPLSEVRLFLDACKAEGIRFRELQLPHFPPNLDWTLLFVSYGVKFTDTCGNITVSKTLFTEGNAGKVDWSNSRQKRYLFAAISLKYNKRDWYEIRCMKSFMKAELDYGRPGVEEAYAEFLDLHQTEKANALTLFHT